MNYKKLKEIWKKEANLKMHGWDFSHLKGRWSNEKLPWDFRTTILKYLKNNDKLLDMATGGGELLLSFKHDDRLTAVTESWNPNIKLIQEKLTPRGIKVYPTKEETDLPVPDNSLDFISNSHGAFKPKLIYKKLHAGGLFVTEQVGATNNFSLSRYLDQKYIPAFPDNTLINSSVSFENEGFKILLAKQAFPELKFFDVGAIVYYASVIPWEFKSFSVDSSFEKLLKLQKIIDNQHYISTNEDRFLIVAQKDK